MNATHVNTVDIGWSYVCNSANQQIDNETLTIQQ